MITNPKGYERRFLEGLLRNRFPLDIEFHKVCVKNRPLRPCICRCKLGRSLEGLCYQFPTRNSVFCCSYPSHPLLSCRTFYSVDLSTVCPTSTESSGSFDLGVGCVPFLILNWTICTSSGSPSAPSSFGLLRRDLGCRVFFDCVPQKFFVRSVS